MTTENWTFEERPGYFGRQRDKKIAHYNEIYGKDNWRLVWKKGDETLTFADACVYFYERSYLEWFEARPEDIDFACSFGECIDNAPTNVLSGTDYTKQEAFSTHIQDIALRNVLKMLARKFEGPADKILTIRSSDSNGHRFGPGNVPFYSMKDITQPSLCPKWALKGSVEDFWQSNKHLQVLDSKKYLYDKPQIPRIGAMIKYLKIGDVESCIIQMETRRADIQP